MVSLRCKSKVLLTALFAICAVGMNGVASAGVNQLRSAWMGPRQWQGQESADSVCEQLQQHFAEVLHRLESNTEKSVSTAIEAIEEMMPGELSDGDRIELRAELLTRRKLQVERLRRYSDAGRFPVNEGQSGTAVPIFVDRSGTHCAVGHLMHVDGFEEHVERIAALRNLRLVHDMGDAALNQWVHSAGLTLDEAAMIQPGYPPPPIEITLEQMQTTMPTYTKVGYTVSNLSILSASYFAGSFADPTEIGINGFDNPDNDPFVYEVQPYQPAAEVGLHMGSMVYDSPYGAVADWNPVLNADWLLIGNEADFSDRVGLGQPRGSFHDSIMFKVDFDIESHDGPFEEFGLTSRALMNFNGVESDSGALWPELRILSRVYDESNNLLGEVDLQETVNVDYYPFDMGLDDHDTINVSGQRLHITTYAMARSDATNHAFKITSFFHEFRSVPEPAGATVMLSLVGLVLAMWRRKPNVDY